MTSSIRHTSWFDPLLISLQRCLQTLSRTTVLANRPSPGAATPEATLSAIETKRSAGMMRVNHTGEVCAQALYLGQSLITQNPTLRQSFQAAAKEENDHLQWCAQRLSELNSHQSYLNSLWFVGSFFIGAMAGLIGDKWSLGFLAQTEQQVFNHLQNHLENLPLADEKSRAIIRQMQQDEAQHATHAISLGAVELPGPVKMSMRLMAKSMTAITYYF